MQGGMKGGAGEPTEAHGSPPVQTKGFTGETLEVIGKLRCGSPADLLLPSIPHSQFHRKSGEVILQITSYAP